MNLWSRRRRADPETTRTPAPDNADPTGPHTTDADPIGTDPGSAGRAEAERVRRDYDLALSENGVVLVQQVGPGVDAFHVSPSMATVLGWDPAAFLAPGILRAMVHPDDLGTFAVAFPLPGDTDETPRVIDLTDGAPAMPRPVSSHLDARHDLVVRFRTAGGAWAHVQVRRAVDPASPRRGVRGSLIDVTQDEQARVTMRRFAELADRDPAGALVLEFVDPAEPASLVIRSANRAAHAMFRLDRPVVDGTPIESVLGPASAQLIRSALFDVSHTGESMTAERLSLTEVRGTYLDLRVDRLGDGTIGMVVTDVTGTVALEERLRHQASHDALTGLPNRSLFEERLAGAVAEVGPDAPVALILVDVDQLREVNEALGLHLGDQLLVEIGRRLVREVRGCAIVSRIGGDEFAVLTMACSSTAEATERARAVSTVLDRPFDVAGHIVSVHTSVGVVVTPDHADDARTAIRFAHAALDSAKQNESRFAVYEAVESTSSIHRLALLAELRQGLANRDLELRYQPVVDLRTGRVDRVEAVLRWRRDDDATRLPVEFLELAEHSGLIQPLTRWILSEAAGAAATIARPDRAMTVSTNLSVRNLFDPDLLTFIGLLISTGELDPSRVELEVAETELMDDPVRSQEVLNRLSEMGLSVVVDEFGTGYTSLSTMRHLPVSGLKIDRSFVAELATVPADAAIVRSTIELCHELGLRVGAEGVADAETLSMLSSFGCDQAQGLHLSGPVTIEELPVRIEQLESAVRGWIGTAEVADA